MSEIGYHLPVLKDEAIAGLAINPDGVYVDVTFGGGGHSSAILEKLSARGRLYAFDQDPDTQSNKPEDSRFRLFSSNFRYAEQFLHSAGVKKVNGILADLGVSSHQFDAASRGFSFRANAPLDMRMNPGVGKSAAQFIKESSEAELAQVFSQYGELTNGKAIAKAIAEKQGSLGIRTTHDLQDAVKSLFPKDYLPAFMARVFQSLRIAVNHELSALTELLASIPNLLTLGGRAVIISYHSLEDRPVKHFFRTGNIGGEQIKDFYGQLIRPLKPLTSKCIVPGPMEIKRNPRASSAKLRIAERL